jgi:hypothetical protein
MRLLLTLASILALTVPAVAQPQNSDFDLNGCVTKEELIVFYTEIKKELGASVTFEDEDTLIFTAPSRPTNLVVTFINGCAAPVAVEVPKQGV